MYREYFMAAYYVDSLPNKKGNNEVHKFGCSHLDLGWKQFVFLGKFSDCREAVEEARKAFPQAEGCYFCARTCHGSLVY